MKGASYAFQAFGHRQCGSSDNGGHGCMGTKWHCQQDPRSHDAGHPSGEEHWAGSVGICPRSLEAQVIRLSNHPKSQNYDQYDHYNRLRLTDALIDLVPQELRAD